MPTTDTAHELWLVLDGINRSVTSNGPAFQELNKFFKSKYDIDEIDMPLKLAFLIQRIRDVINQIRSSAKLDDDDRKKRHVQAFEELLKTFKPPALTEAWQDVKKKYFKSDFLTRLDALSSTLRHEFGFSKMNEEDIEFVNKQIYELLDGLDNSFDPTLSAVIRQTMDMVKRVLDKEPFYEPRELAEKTIVASTMLKQASGRAKTDKESRAIERANMLFMTIFALYIGIPQVAPVTEEFWKPTLIGYMEGQVSEFKSEGKQPYHLPSFPREPLRLTDERPRDQECEQDREGSV